MLSYFMGCIALVRCVLVLRCGLAVVVLFHGLYCSGSMCVGVTLWFGCGGVISWVVLSNTTHEITQQISRKLLRMDVLTLETC